VGRYLNQSALNQTELTNLLVVRVCSGINKILTHATIIAVSALWLSAHTERSARNINLDLPQAARDEGVLKSLHTLQRRKGEGAATMALIKSHATTSPLP